MITIKSFTDLEQSKILEKILPPESADSVIVTSGTREGTETVVMPNRTLDIIRDPFSDIRETVHCWSLAALFDMLPKFIGDYGKCLYYDVDGYHCGYMDDGNFMLTIQETKADNSVDACCDMIINLYKLSLL